jgi:hypothetical protein
VTVEYSQCLQLEATLPIGREYDRCARWYHPGMLEFLLHKARRVLVVAVAFAPWLISMYVLYWLEYSAIWSHDTPHRGKLSVAILVVGMSLTFFAYTTFAQLKRR